MPFAKKCLLPDEEVIILARQHPLVLLRPLSLNILVLALLVAVSIISAKAWLILFWLAPLAYFFWEYLCWRHRVYILTNRRVLKQEGLLSVSSFDASLDKINNAFHRQSFLGRLLGYGEVGLETASEQGTVVFNFLSRPLTFKNAIMQQREFYRSDSLSNASSASTIPRLIDELASLRDRNIITTAEFEEKKKALLEKL